MRRALIVSAALALLLAVPASSDAAVRSRLGANGAMRLTLSGRVLTAKIVKPRIDGKLFGKRIDAVCSARAPVSRRGLLIKRRLWPAGAPRLTFRFSRDISRTVKWCLVEHRAADVAVAWFLRREPARFIAKGRGPGGDWWRLAGFRGRLAEPCALVRSREWGAGPCFEPFADRPVTLAARQLAPSGQDAIVFGVAAREAAVVRITTADGATVDAALYDRPAGSRVQARYFVAAFSEGTQFTGVESFDADGRSLRRIAAPRTSARPRARRG